jgi:hypothetical protein
MSGQAIVRAVLTGSDGTRLDCQFNPTTLRVRKNSMWHAFPTRGARWGPRPQFVGTGPEVLSATLLFDGFDTLGGTSRPVAAVAAQLLDWTCVSPDSYDAATPQPPMVTFRWGTGVSLTGFLRAVDIQYTMFGADGTPLRATADISLQRVPEEPRPTNPTSGGVSGRRSALFADGDSLPSIAYREYGDPNLWRALAVANGIEDPCRVPTGSRLLVPPRARAAELATPAGADGEA